jgi:hypothetical protein
VKLTSLLFATLALTTAACGRISAPAEDEVPSSADPIEVAAPAQNPKVGGTAAGTSVVVRKDKDEVRVVKDGTSVRTGGGNTEVNTSDGKSVKVKDGRVEVGGVKVDGTKVTVPGVATVYGY